MDEFDWMDTGADAPSEREQQLVSQELAWLFDDPANPLPAGITKARKKDPKFFSLAVATRALPYRQKLFLKCMLTSAFTPGRARKKMEAAGAKVDPHTTIRWMQNPEFKAIMDRYGELALMSSGAASPVSILNRIDDVVEDAMTPVPKFHDGRQLRTEDGTPVMEVDRGSALKGLKSMAEIAGMLKKDDENRARVTVVLDFSGEQMQGEQAEKDDGVLEGEFEEARDDAYLQ